VCLVILGCLVFQLHLPTLLLHGTVALETVYKQCSAVSLYIIRYTVYSYSLLYTNLFEVKFKT